MIHVTIVVPWFLKNLPASYFKQVPELTRNQHIKAVAALKQLKQSDLSLKIDTKHDDGSYEISFIFNDSAPGALYRQINSLQIPDDCSLSNVKVFSAIDGSLNLNIFSFESVKGDHICATKENASKIFDYVAEVKAGKHASDLMVPKYNEKLFSDQALSDYLKLIRPNYAEASNPRRFLIQREMYEQVRSTENVEVVIENLKDGINKGAWITIAAANVLPEVLLRLSSAMISSRNLDILRAHLDVVQDSDNMMGPDMPGSITMLRILISDPLKPIDIESAEVKVLLKNIKQAKWLDDEVTNIGLIKYPNIGIDKAEIIVALCSMVHGPLSKLRSQSFASIKSIIQVISNNATFMQIADDIAQLFVHRFNPAAPLPDTDYQSQSKSILTRIDRILNEDAKTILLKLVDGVSATLRTNFYNRDRYALGLRVNPTIMATGNIGQPDGKPLPFGVIFAHGRHFNGFHCRFRDIARGGLRIVTPPHADQYALESSRQFDEAYGLSYAQQLKNKDIPEGGAKAVVLINSPTIEPNKRFYTARKCVKAFTDSILDLIVKDSVKNLVDLYRKDELIYLGPDEQIIPFDIDWICDRAAVRGYPIPAAFMSSKQGAGINHKQYGVTSEGVVVYLDVALRKMMNINPNESPFTIKITGGPDGDVAGNLIKILFREYGTNCKVVGIADGFGVAEDPNGLDANELLRLVEESLPITSFNKSKLSSTGICLDASTEEGFAKRNTMHFRVKADAFVPAGGRPNTINADNWKQFLDSNGQPTSSLIVEGANLFLTAEARDLLFQHAGVKIVKDSSANKCGVITSSCEVAASMLLSRDEFLNVKKELVEDVVVKIKELARFEAELLFREFANYPGALPHFSERISNAISIVTDAITDALANVNPEDELFKKLKPLIKDNLPKKLADVAWDRVPSRFPLQYQKNAIASTLASYIVYKEGIHLIETQPLNRVAERSIMYYFEEAKLRELVSDLEKNDMKLTPENKQQVIDLLRRGGARTSLSIF